MSTMTKATWVGKSLSQLTGHSPPSGKPEQELKANTEAGTVEEHWAHWAYFLTHLRPTWTHPHQLAIQKLLCRQATGTPFPDVSC